MDDYSAANAIRELTREVSRIGLNGAVTDRGTEFGGLELVALEIKKSREEIVQAINNLAETVSVLIHN